MPKKDQKLKKIRVVIYSRVSTQEQIERTEYYSMQSHMDRCKFYIKAQGNWELVKIYEDPAESGDKWEATLPRLCNKLQQIPDTRQ